MLIHGLSNTPTHRIWMGLRNRCNNQNNRIYKFYGGKGIKVCPEWNDFNTFLNDMGERPAEMEIDRIDPTADYCKDNCRWVTKKQNRSTQRNRLIDITGMKFGKWLVLDRNTTQEISGQVYWNCKCECGRHQSIIGTFLRRGKTKQCRDCKNKAHGKIHKGWSKRLKIEKK